MAKPTIGGKEVEVFSEAFFCIYFALHIKKKLNDYKATDWLSIKNAQDMTKWARKKTILPIIKKELNDHEFTSRIKLISTFLIDKEWDERLTSKQAEKYLLESGVEKNKIKEKIDSASAVIILESYILGQRR